MDLVSIDLQAGIVFGPILRELSGISGGRALFEKHANLWTKCDLTFRSLLACAPDGSYKEN